MYMFEDTKLLRHSSWRRGQDAVLNTLRGVRSWIIGVFADQSFPAKDGLETVRYFYT